MSLADSPHAAKVSQLLQGLDQDTLLSLARTATNNRIIPQDAKEAIEVVLIHTPDLSRFFSYRRIKAQMLFEYLASRKVRVNSHSSKIQYITAVQDFWEKEMSSSRKFGEPEPWGSPLDQTTDFSSTTKVSPTVKLHVKADIKSKVSVTIINNYIVKPAREETNIINDTRGRGRGRERRWSDNATIERERETNDTSNPFRRLENTQTPPVTTLSTAAPFQSQVKTISSDVFTQDFCNWYYTMVNRLQPACAQMPGDTLREEVFLNNSSAEVYVYGATTTQKSATGQTGICTLLKDFFTEFKILFCPNVKNGVQAYATNHGLVKVMVCGTLHQDNSFVGVFEQEFGLVLSPVDRAWKIMYTKLNLKQTGQTTPTPSLPKSEVFAITM